MSDIRFNRWLHQSGTGGVYQDSSGRVGIGSSVPTTALDIVGIVSATSFTGNLTGNVVGNVTGNINSTGVTTVTSLRIGTGTSISSPATNVLTLGTNDSERVRITSSGLVGIGTDNPGYKLHVTGGSIYHNGTGSLPLYINANGSSGDPDRLAYLQQSVSDTAAYLS